MSKLQYIPDQGDIIWLVFDPRVGHEQTGRRPALVISHQLFSTRTGLALVCPITSKIKGLPYELNLVGTTTAGAVLSIHLKSVDYSIRKAKFIEKAPRRIVEKVVEQVGLIVGA